MMTVMTMSRKYEGWVNRLNICTCAFIMMCIVLFINHNLVLLSICYIRACSFINNHFETPKLFPDHENMGTDILFVVLVYTVKQIAENRIFGNGVTN